MASSAIQIKKRVSVPKEEYVRLKRLERRFGEIISYFERIEEVREAREEVKKGKVIPQEELFRTLGI